MSVRVEYFQNMFFFANLRVKLEHVRVSLVFVCLPLKYERNKGSINSFVVIGNLEILLST